MIPVMCRVKHAPDEGTYGDCLRACVASLMEMDGDTVPHFHGDNPSAEEAQRRVIGFLGQHGAAPFYVAYDGDATCAEILELMAVLNPTAHYLLFGQNSGGDHVVVCHGGKVVHDPNWYPSPLVRCGSRGAWVVMVIARG